MNSNLDSELKAKWSAYKNRKKEFRESHKAQRCSSCGEEIQPGDVIWFETFYDRMYCSAECYANAHGATHLYFENEGYESWFDAKEGIGR